MTDHPISPPDFEGLASRRARENAQFVLTQLERGDRNILDNIQRREDEFYFSRDEIVEEITTRPMYAATFAKKPSRQGIYEEIAADWIRGLSCVNSFQRLSKAGNNTFYVEDDGRIVSGPNRPKSVRALNFTWMTGDTEFYALHCYMKQSGGSQDSRFDDLLQILRRFQIGSAELNHVLVLLVDGAYFTFDILEEMNRLSRTNAPHSFASSTGTLPSVLRDLEILA